MGRDRSTQFVQTSLGEEDIDAVLESQGYGVVSLCEDGDPYSIPVSFGYDGEHVYFPFLITGDEATKTEFIEEGTVVRLLITEVRDLFNWRSVTVTDRVASVDPDGSEWDHFIDVLVQHDWFKPGFEEASAIESIQGWKLGLDDCHGMERKTFAYE